MRGRGRPTGDKLPLRLEDHAGGTSTLRGWPGRAAPQRGQDSDSAGASAMGAMVARGTTPLRRLAGTVLGLAGGVLVLFQSIGVLSGTQVALNLPIAVQEMVLAVWLIVKGFGPQAEAPAPALSPALAGQRVDGGGRP